MWLGSFHLGNCFALYVGESGSNETHSHATYQLIICESGTVEVVDEFNEVLEARSVLINPLVPHSIRSQSTLKILYLEPQSDLIFRLLKQTTKKRISSFDLNCLEIEPCWSSEEIIRALRLLAPKPSPNIDRRILRAMQLLNEHPGGHSIADVAKQSGLSESRLRTIAREQLKVPLATWHLWCKLQTSINTLQRGQSLIDAAAIGGFADQAHFSRTMRQMFGITPTTAIKAIR